MDVNARPVPKNDAVREQMESQRRRDTTPETALRRLLHAQGLRYRLEVPVPGIPRRTIDIAFARAKVAVFVDGCFWHGCPLHGVAPRNNAEWWAAKLAANRERDEDTTRHLESLGWTVLRFWEHEDAVTSAARVRAALPARVRRVRPPL